jgi:predicted ATP-dependent serine protease
VPQAALRVREAAQMGFTRLIIPSANVDPAIASRNDVEYQIIGVRTLGEALDQLIA